MSRFLFISTAEGLSWGGSEVLWAQVAQQLLSQKHHVAYSYQYFLEEPEPLVNLCDAGAVGYYRGDPASAHITYRVRRAMRLRKLQSCYPAFSRPHWLLSLVMEEQPDLVILNCCDAYNVWPMSNAFDCLREQGLKYAIICQLEDEAVILGNKKWAALRQLFSGAQEVSFGSQRGADLLSRQLALRLPNVQVFDNPANISGQLRLWDENDQQVARFACVGRLDVCAKGQDAIIAAFSQSLWRDRSWRLTYYGKGWQEDYLRQLAAMYELDEQIHFAGFVPDVDSIWAKEHVCLQPSPKEGTPMTVVEAMAAGRPCLVTDIGRMPDLIEEGKSGWVCSRGVTSVSAALERAWTQRDQWRQMGEAAHAKINEVWNFKYPEQMAERFVRLARK